MERKKKFFTCNKVKSEGIGNRLNCNQKSDEQMSAVMTGQFLDKEKYLAEFNVK